MLNESGIQIRSRSDFGSSRSGELSVAAGAARRDRPAAVARGTRMFGSDRRRRFLEGRRRQEEYE